MWRLALKPSKAALTVFDLAVLAFDRMAVLVLALSGLVASGFVVAVLASGPALVVEAFGFAVGRGIIGSTDCSS